LLPIPAETRCPQLKKIPPGNKKDLPPFAHQNRRTGNRIHFPLFRPDSSANPAAARVQAGPSPPESIYLQKFMVLSDVRRLILMKSFSFLQWRISTVP
jgi:hypothetical protein